MTEALQHTLANEALQMFDLLLMKMVSSGVMNLHHIDTFVSIVRSAINENCCDLFLRSFHPVSFYSKQNINKNAVEQMKENCLVIFFDFPARCFSPKLHLIVKIYAWHDAIISVDNEGLDFDVFAL